MEFQVSGRFVSSLRALAIVTWVVVPLAQAPAAQKPSMPDKANAPNRWTPGRTVDGQPDLQGVWEFSTITPLERPGSLGDKQVFTDQEAAAFERDENRRLNRDLIDPAKGGVTIRPAASFLTMNSGTTAAPRSSGRGARRSSSILPTAAFLP